MSKLAVTCAGKKDIKRPVLPHWLLEPCHASAKGDTGMQLCSLLLQEGNDEEVIKYVQQHGIHPSDYGFNLRGTLAFFQQHSHAISAKMNAAMALS